MIFFCCVVWRFFMLMVVNFVDVNDWLTYLLIKLKFSILIWMFRFWSLVFRKIFTNSIGHWNELNECLYWTNFLFVCLHILCVVWKVWIFVFFLQINNSKTEYSRIRNFFNFETISNVGIIFCGYFYHKSFIHLIRFYFNIICSFVCCMSENEK